MVTVEFIGLEPMEFEASTITELVDFDTLSTHSLHRQIAYIQNY